MPVLQRISAAQVNLEKFVVDAQGGSEDRAGFGEGRSFQPAAQGRDETAQA
ncbi:hypothetical protein [Pseudomonas sp. BN102]|uniref:hypothetical protein n=1 Tax=Pseudomonas sp. BN102 TaxID=2567886 RepID=UPI002456BEC9|nr:hypothetical protein [Pseudomonas sp. BN102]